MSNSSVVCPGEAVLFTCSVPGDMSSTLRWQVDPPAESGLMTMQSTLFLGSQVGRRDTFGFEMIMFEAVLVSSDGVNLTSILINLSEVSVLDGSIVTCTATSITVAKQQTILVAGE